MKKRVKRPRPPRSKYPPGTPCAYCGEVVAVLTRDHVFAEKWYPKATREDQMLKVPACSLCNGFFGKHVEEAGTELVLTTQPTNPFSQDAQQAFSRSIDPTAARSGDETDRRARLAKLRRIQANLTLVMPGEKATTMWSVEHSGGPLRLQTESGLLVRGFPGMALPHRAIRTMIGKWVRACCYLESGSPLDLYVPWKPRIVSADRDPIPLVLEFSCRLPHRFEHPAFRVWGTTMPNDPRSSLWMFLVWNELAFFGMSGSLALLPDNEEDSSPR
jgi:hypothetical protein